MSIETNRNSLPSAKNCPKLERIQQTIAKLNDEGILLLKWLTRRKADKKYSLTKQLTITLGSDSSDGEHNETNNEITNEITIEITNSCQYEHNTTAKPNNEHDHEQTSTEHSNEETTNETTHQEQATNEQRVHEEGMLEQYTNEYAINEQDTQN